VVSVWGADVIDFPSNWFTRAFIRKVLRAADHVTATSQLLKRVSEKFLPSVADKITVIPFGVRVLESFKPPPPPIPPRLCFFKALKRKYGPDILLQAMVRVVEAIPNIQLSIAGFGELKEVLLKMTTDLNLDQNVTYVGFIDNAKIYDFVQEHHMMVMPSVMESESFGVAVLEASACGRAVIASRVGGVPEVLIDGQTGILVPPARPDELAEAIIKLATDPELCAQMGQKGHSFVGESYDWEDSVDAMAELYGRMINGDGSVCKT
jgi:glycosyltransferase involved in cell wall biosynthesis